MAFSYSRLCEITTIAAAAGALITNNSGETAYIRLIVIHNTNTTTETVKLYNVPDNAGAVGTAGDNTNRFYNEALPTGESRFLEFGPPGMILEDTNDTIQGVTTTANKVTFQAYGGKE